MKDVFDEVVSICWLLDLGAPIATMTIDLLLGTYWYSHEWRSQTEQTLQAWGLELLDTGLLNFHIFISGEIQWNEYIPDTFWTQHLRPLGHPDNFRIHSVAWPELALGRIGLMRLILSSYSPSWREVGAGSQGRDLKQKPWRNAACWPTQGSWLVGSLLCCFALVFSLSEFM